MISNDCGSKRQCFRGSLATQESWCRVSNSTLFTFVFSHQKSTPTRQSSEKPEYVVFKHLQASARSTRGYSERRVLLCLVGWINAAEATTLYPGIWEVIPSTEHWRNTQVGLWSARQKNWQGSRAYANQCSSAVRGEGAWRRVLLESLMLVDLWDSNCSISQRALFEDGPTDKNIWDKEVPVPLSTISYVDNGIRKSNFPSKIIIENTLVRSDVDVM